MIEMAKERKQIQACLNSLLLAAILTVIFYTGYFTVFNNNTISPKSFKQGKQEIENNLTPSNTQLYDRQSTSPYIEPLYPMKSYREDKKHTILLWNPPSWFLWIINYRTDINWCTYRNCLISQDRALFNHSSAVVFNPCTEGMGGHPPVHPDQRNPNQVWVFFSLESPSGLYLPELKSPQWKNVFNWTWTYKTNSDVFQPYGLLIPKETSSTKNYSDIFRKKTKFAAWVVSHCETPCKRENYVKILQKYVDVDIYGGCGTVAPKDLNTFISMNYKFYIGFENSLCEDYITEKFFNYYELDVINVVRGHSNYSTYFPEGTFIDTANFSSISALAKYMNYLANNEAEYVKYLQIKDRFTVYSHHAFGPVCTMCEKLNNLEQNRKTYSDALEWLGPCYHDIQDLKEDASIYPVKANSTSYHNTVT